MILFEGYKMADGDSSRNWQLFFNSLLSILDDCESVPRTSLPGSLEREMLGMRLEQAVYALQQILTLSVDQGDSESEGFLYELLRNYQLLQIELNRSESSTHCSTLAVYTLESPPVSRTNNIGRPKLEISEHVLLQLRSLGFKWRQISDMLLVSRWTIRRRVVEFGIQETTGFTDITDAELDGLVQQFMLEHGSLMGCAMISGRLRSLGLRVQRQRVRESIVRVDPANVRLRWASVVYRRAYSVPGPNSLWHLDGHHSLVNWGFVVHGAIDGFSRCILFLQCSTNNKCDTVRQLFLSATNNFGWPSRVRTDCGGENVRVWELMEEYRGPNRGSYLAGSSVHNQRIERLWRDVFCMVCHIYYYTFQAMEEQGILNRNNDIHLFLLHYVFCPRINRALESLTSSWNNHPIRTERNWSPIQMWTNGMLDIRNHELVGVADVVGDADLGHLEWFGYDPQAPPPDDDGLSTVEVEDITIDLSDNAMQQLRNEVNPLEFSDSFGIDLYVKALSIV